MEKPATAESSVENKQEGENNLHRSVHSQDREEGGGKGVLWGYWQQRGSLESVQLDSFFI